MYMQTNLPETPFSVGFLADENICLKQSFCSHGSHWNDVGVMEKWSLWTESPCKELVFQADFAIIFWFVLQVTIELL